MKNIFYSIYNGVYALLVLICATSLYSPAAYGADKRTANWLFCKKLSMEFSFSSPITYSSILGQLEATAGCASISSPSTGALLFYTNGETIWNKNHVVMQNGSGLLGNGNAVQSSIIIPHPGNQYPDRYYVFYVGTSHKCYYTEVDMSANSGLGAVNTSEKNVELASNIASSITSCQHSNGMDTWLVLHGFNNATFKAYRITAMGVNPGNLPAFYNSIAGSSFRGLSLITGPSETCMKLSPNGQYIATAIRSSESSGNVELFSFDNVKGQVSTTYKTIVGSLDQPYGVEYSPDSRFLYITGAFAADSYVITDYTISQVDVSDGNRVPIGRISSGISSNQRGGSIQLGLDGSIYFVVNDNNSKVAIMTIRNPNERGEACSLEHTGQIYTNQSGASRFFSLPNFITSYFDESAATPACDECVENYSVIAWGTPQNVVPSYAHPLCGGGITITYQTRMCNNVRDIRILGIEIPCQNNSSCSLEEFLWFYEDLILAQAFPGVTISNNTKIRFFVAPCWQKIYCSTRSSILWWLSSQSPCCSHSYTIQTDCNGVYDRTDIVQSGDEEFAIGKSSFKNDISFSCTPDRTLLEYSHPCLETYPVNFLEERYQIDCRRTDWKPYRP